MSLQSRLKNQFASENFLWPRIKSTAFLFFILTFGIELGRIGRDSFFLSTAGPSKIPYMYLFMAVLMLVASGTYSLFVDRVRRDIFLKYLLGAGLAFSTLTGVVLKFKINIPYFPYIVFVVCVNGLGEKTCGDLSSQWKAHGRARRSFIGGI